VLLTPHQHTHRLGLALCRREAPPPPLTPCSRSRPSPWPPARAPRAKEQVDTYLPLRSLSLSLSVTCLDCDRDCSSLDDLKWDTTRGHTFCEEISICQSWTPTRTKRRQSVCYSIIVPPRVRTIEHRRLIESN
jgi:hypothetical protein